MLLGQGWGTTCEIEAASTLFGFHIHVWVAGENEDGQTVYFPQRNTIAYKPEAETIDTLLMHNHFQLLKTKKLCQLR